MQKLLYVFLRNKSLFLFLIFIAFHSISFSQQQNLGRITGNVINEKGELLSGVRYLTYRQVKNDFQNPTALLVPRYEKLQYVSVANIVTGRVTNSKGEPLVKVSVTTGKRTTTGTSTNANGNYTIDAPANGTLIFSHVGYERKEVQVNGQSVIDVQLKQTETELDQVVVIGYGTEKRINLTGAVEHLGGEALEDRPMPNVARGLEGALPGVFVNMPTGSPVQDFSPMIRGLGSIGAGGSALVLIDGVPGDLNTLNPADIKDISVLKDAAASAIYGARGAFGVVLVTTKSSKSGQVKLNYSFNYSLNTRAVKPELLTNGYLWAKNFDEAYFQWSHDHPTTINTGMTFSQDYLEELKKLNEQNALPKIDVDPSTGKYIYYGSSDWQRLLFNDNDPSMQHQLSLSGGNKDVNYYLSGRLFQQQGIFNYSPDKFKQYNFRAKGSFQVFPWLKMGNNLSYSQRSYFYPLSVRSPNTNILRRLTDEFNPLSFLQNPDGTLTKSAALTFGSFLTGNNFNNDQWRELRNSFDFEAGFLNDDLAINGNFSYVYSPFLEEQRAAPVPYSEKPGEILLMDVNQDYAGETTQRENYVGANLFASYKHSFGKHNFKVLVGYNYENTDLLIRHYRRNKMINPSLPDPGLLTGEDIQLTGGGYEWTTSGEFFRLNYNFSEKYLLEINGRYDGSSKFPVNQQLGFFPSASAGWRISNESFWKVSPSFISNLKLRVSYGSLGNGNVSPYQFLETMPVNTLNSVIGGIKPLYTNNPNVIPNGLTWEKSTTANLGLDAGFLNNRLLLNFDIYRRKTTGMFTQGVSLPSVFGAAVPKGNYADMRTPGWEVSLAWNNQSRGSHPIRYSLSFHLSDNYSVVERFNNPQGLIEEYYAGKRLGDIWGYEVPGFYQTQKQLDDAPDQTRVYVTSRDKNRLEIGDLRFIDLDGNGKIDYGTLTLDNKGDLVKIGNSQPRYLFGFNGNVDWNSFSLSVFFEGIGKRDWWPGSETWQFWGQFNRPYTSMPIDVNNQIYSFENPNAYFPNLVGYEANNNDRSKAMNSPSTYFLQNAAYIRLKNLSIGYNLPKSLISKIKLESAKVFFTGQNLWVWSPMFKITKALDPEAIGSQSSSNSETDTYLMETLQSDEGSVYPILKTFTIGVNVTF